MRARGCLSVAREVLGDLRGRVDRGRAGVKAGRELPPLTAEGVVGAAFSVIHTRLLEQDPEPLGGCWAR